MEKNLEVNIAFKIWNQLNQLESILWDRYRAEFLNLTIEQDDKDPSQDDHVSPIQDGRTRTRHRFLSLRYLRTGYHVSLLLR